MLNMLFDFSKTDGLFSDFVDLSANPDPLKNSKRWLRYNGPDPSGKENPGNPEPNNKAVWVDLKRFNVLIPKAASGHNVALRFAPVPGTEALLTATAQLDCVVAFGRPLSGQQAFASPFRQGTNVKTTYFRIGATRGAGEIGWFVPLDQIHANSYPPEKDLTNRFEFAIGIVVKSGGNERHFGEDPEEDVGG